ncbi:MAG: hypothetical protein B6D46_04880 [Polyangiaceae bacterium UTPRO1]|jgi:glutathione S-transferase|nr:glutathione transferase [Myxococcales bacterium]OQY68013.1 MAG: hypothetical protein B6D46_04880 [Polyangiaceae bacterium UTPRO1]
MSTAPLVLYGEPFWTSPYVFSCFVALREKRLSFSVELVDLAGGAHRRPPFLDRTLTGKVPALAHGDFWLAESTAIIEYLEEVFPPPAHPAVLPMEPFARARARQVMAWIRSDLAALRSERPTTTMFYERATAPLSPAGEAAAADLLRVAAAIVPATSPHLFGTWSIADADLTFMLHRLLANGHAVPARIAEYAAAQWQRPSVREFVDRRREPHRPHE